MSRPRFRRLLLLVALFIAWRVWAGSAENFSGCSKSNDCKSLQCTKNRCEPSVQWNGHGKLGTECNNDGNCASHTCVKHTCVAAPTPKVKATPTPGRATPTGTPKVTKDSDDDDDDEPDEPEEQPTPEIVLDACSKKLVKDLDVEDYPEVAVEICNIYDDATIARAMVLYAGDYGIGVIDTCRAILGHSDTEIACGKKAYAALSKDDRDVFPFKIPVSCVTKQTPEELGRCTKDLMATVGSNLREASKEADAAYACSTYDAKTLETAKKVTRSGYGGDFLLLCRTVDGRSKEELACARKEFDQAFGGPTREYEFHMPTECEDRSPRK